MTFINLLSAGQLPRDVSSALAILLLVIVAALLFRLRDALPEESRPEAPSPEDSWAGFEARLAEVEVAEPLRAALIDFARGHHNDDPAALLDDRLSFDRFVVATVSDSAGLAPAERHQRLAAIQGLRDALDLHPIGQQRLISSREIEIGTWLELAAVHPDFEELIDARSVRVLVSNVDAARIEVEAEDSESLSVFAAGQQVWVKFQHESHDYRFRAPLTRTEPDSACLEHGAFLIREKRSEARYELSLALAFEWREQSHAAELVNISAGGLALTSEVLVPLGQVLSLQFPGREQAIAVEVRNVSPFSERLVKLHSRFASPQGELLQELLNSSARD